MGNSPDATDPPLREALIRWCDEKRLAAVIEAQKFFSDYELRHKRRFPIHGVSNPASMRRPGDENREFHAARALDHAWDVLIEDFQRRIQSGKIYLRGIRTRPKRQETSDPIPSGWAMDFEFDFSKDVITIDLTYRYVNVTASTKPPELRPQADPVGQPPAVSITPEIVRTLDNETILKLLEENASRVVADPTAKLFPPGKLTVMPLIQGKMRYRAEKKELLNTLAAEAAWLHDWASSRVSLHHVPIDSTIMKVLGKEYAVRNTRSNAAIQNLKS